MKVTCKKVKNHILKIDQAGKARTGYRKQWVGNAREIPLGKGCRKEGWMGGAAMAVKNQKSEGRR